jgi:CHAD domain-containing protein
MARARAIKGLDAGQPFAEAAREIVAVRADEVLVQLRKLARRADADAVHDVRVACRRLRAVLEIFEPCFEPKAHRRALAAVKGVGGDLGERRDLDVQRAFLAGLSSQASARDQAGISALIESMDDDVEAAELKVKAVVEHAADKQLLEVFAALPGAVRG